MYMLVHDPTLGSEAVFAPGLLHMDQGALARAEGHVLQGGKLNQIIDVEHIVTQYLYRSILPNCLYCHIHYRVLLAAIYLFNRFLLSGSVR